MTRATLLALADRVEALTGPCRETDHAIYAAANPDKPLKEGHRLLPWCHCYTESLDAAVTLAPDGWSWSVGEMRGVEKWRGWLNDHNTANGIARRHVDADASTEPLARTAAALRARAMMEIE